jgi:glycosyltransferase involved in cell wall biosynthesis
MRTIGVVIPAYNRAQYISETLDAILSQTRPVQEIVVVDDGSTDNTQEVLRRYASRVISVKVANGGDLRAKNIGLEKLQTDLVSFCDSDDLWEADFAEVMSRQWDYTPDLQVCYANFRILTGTDVRPTTKFDDAPGGFWSDADWVGEGCGVFRAPYIERLMEFQPFFPSCMIAARSAFLARGGWDDSVGRILGCDFGTAIKISVTPPVGFVLKPLVRIRKHAGNFSADTEKMNLGDALVLEHVLRVLPEAKSVADSITRSIAKRRAEAIDSAFSRKDFQTFNKYYPGLPCEFRDTKRRIKRVISAAGGLIFR